MKKEQIEILVRTGILRKRQLDKERIKSMLASSQINAKVAKSIPLNDETATTIFRELYESIRQLGDVKWWLIGYEPNNHEISLDILKEMDVKEKIKLNFLNRFKRIRHDANYKGFRVTVPQAQEMLDFWDACAVDIIRNLSTILQT